MENTISLDLDQIKKLYLHFANSNEENIKNHVISRLLEDLGYDPLLTNYEHPMYHNSGRADISIKIDYEKTIFVETKSGNYILTEKDIEQLANYLNNQRQEWGILTNGRRYLLINNNIKIPASSEYSIAKNRVVFDIDLFNKKDVKYLQYLSKINLFDLETTNYYRDITQFKALRFPNENSSWNNYKGTLYDFFTYYLNKEKRYRILEEIRVDDFEEYLNYYKEQSQTKRRSLKAKDTVNNKYSHIRSFFIHLNKNKIITSHHFAQEKKKLVKKINHEVTVKNTEVLNVENIQKVIDFLKDNYEYSTRNEVIFLFCLYMGMDRSTLKNLTVDMLDLKKGTLNIEERVIPLPILMQDKIKILLIENNLKKIKGNHLFYTLYKKKYNKISESTINFVFESLEAIDAEDEKWSFLSPSFIRNNLIKKLFESNYSIEEIAYLTGSDLASISKLISYEDIKSKVDLTRTTRKKIHPYNQFLYI